MENAVKIVIELESGLSMNAELYPDVAPNSVANFLELIDAKFFDGVCFHRVIPGFMIQGGGFVWKNGLVDKKAAKNVKGEFRSNGVTNNLKHEPGILSMARAQDKNSASSQFFLCTGNTSFLDGEYAAFGKVSDKESLDVAFAIAKEKTTRWQHYDDVPVNAVVIKTIKRA